MRRREQVFGRAVGSRIAALATVLALVCVAAPIAGAKVAHKADAFTAHGSAEQVYVTGVTPGSTLWLLNRFGRRVGAQPADSLGGIVFRNVKPGRGYRVHEPGGESSSAVTVFSNRPAPPETLVYSQTIPKSGYGYLTTRDGTQLAIDVRLPSGPGPYPTLIEYAGYGYANPAGAESGISQVANLLGFAVVDINMRGTGCSGGAFDYFEPLQSLDGYDVIETVARQPWVSHNKVGMIGISYGGISQLFVGSTAPPSLAAIAPLSVIDNSATTLYPGGILNTGFALAWAQERVHDALPASPTGGQPWALKQIQNGDQTCKSNQVLHGEAVDLIAKVRANNYYVPSVADPASPVTFVNKIKAPTYVACQWTDEQTGGHCADLAEHFTGTSHKWFTFTNGTHVDSLDPVTFNRWYDFLELYVARQAPNLSPLQRAAGPVVYQTAMGIPNVTLPPDPIQGLSYSAALSAFQNLKPIRVLFDNGGGSSTAGAPYPAFEQSFGRFPIPRTQARFWFLGSNGQLRNALPSHAGADVFKWNVNARPLTDFTGDTGSGGLWNATPNYNWVQHPAGTAVSYVSPPLRGNTAIIGAGALHAWIRSSTPDADLQVTISEIRPDGKETFVQSGWLRASERKLDRAKSTLLEPTPSFRKVDVAPLPRGRFTKLTIPLYYEGHVYRAGSRIRVTISAPNGDQPIWSFSETVPSGKATIAIAHSKRMPSWLVLPVVPGVSVPTGLPPCPGLRGEPCRPYQAIVNRTTKP